ncbi:MAG: ABC transporter permease [Candidatus Rokuibacteriota bacterium]|jgi:putative spermidine/putrescine transport system permease protein|nr:MAG: ABC transporter permease [Candidatus Rokubacteria bacterium]
MRGRVWRLVVFVFIVGFTLNLVGIVSHVAVSSLARRWFATPLPGAFTTEWYAYAWHEFQLPQVLTVTATVAASVTALALLLGFPAAYVLARRGFRAKNAVLLLYFLPLLIPQMTYGIPLATSLYRYRIGGTVAGVILANLVPMLPLAIFVLLPFVEQISESLEWAARVHGAGRWQVFRRVVLPLALPGLLTAGLLVLVNTVANFELTFLLSGAGSQTLVVALYYAVFAAGMRPIYSVDAMAVIYMGIVLLILVAALRFVRPTQMVFRLGGK